MEAREFVAGAANPESEVSVEEDQRLAERGEGELGIRD
jgi:hypothetical protein